MKSEGARLTSAVRSRAVGGGGWGRGGLRAAVGRSPESCPTFPWPSFVPAGQSGGAALAEGFGGKLVPF